MTSGSTNRQHKILRKRPTDATGLFWALVCLTFGPVLFFAVPLLGIAAIASTPLCLIHQIATWRNECRAWRDAITWCDRHYLPEAEVPLVDFMVALSLCTNCSLERIAPCTELNEIYGKFDEDWIDITEAEWHRMRLGEIFKNARIKKRDLKSFQGKRLKDAIELLQANSG